MLIELTEVSHFGGALFLEHESIVSLRSYFFPVESDWYGSGECTRAEVRSGSVYILRGAPAVVQESICRQINRQQWEDRKTPREREVEHRGWVMNEQRQAAAHWGTKK